MIIDNKFKEKVLDYYGGVIDRCLFGESSTNKEIKDDPILSYLANSISEFLGQDAHQHLWKQALRTDLMRFLEDILEMYYTVIKDYHKQLALIEQFANINLQEKMMMWERVYGSIINHYTIDELYFEAYNKLLLDADGKSDIKAILDVFVNDWRKENQKKKNDRIKSIIENYGNNPLSKSYGSQDYRINKEVETTYNQYPILREIVEIIGREREISTAEEMQVMRKFQPAFISENATANESEIIALGNRVSHLVSTEYSLLTDLELEKLFYYKYATKNLMIYSNVEQTASAQSDKNTTKRLQAGPIIVCLDTSSSMSGSPEKIAKCMLLQLLDVAKRKNRKLYLITFSVRAQAIDLSNPTNWRMINQFLNNRFTGGTSPEAMLNEALATLRKSNYSLADVLIISDFIFKQPSTTTIESINKAHKNGARFYGLMIGNYSSACESLLTKMWRV
jgi:uncharacterized protein with von Willebrand factor type A (vWA) domain